MLDMIKICFIDDSYGKGSSSFRKIEGDLLFKNNPDSIYVDVNSSAFRSKTKITADAAYTIGLNTTINCIGFFEQHEMPFCFELYPGFGFNLDIDENELIKIFKHPLFRGVIVTMPATLNFINNIDSIELGKNIYYKFGGFPDITAYKKSTEEIPKPKIYFVAIHYGGKYNLTKGSDVFLEAAKKFPDYQFVMVGGWPEIKLDNLSQFPECKNIEIFKLYNSGDIFLSFNRVIEGIFDGFPTTGAIESMLSGCCLLATDFLNNKEELVDNEHFIEINEKNIFSCLEEVLKNEKIRLDISSKGQSKVLEIYNPEEQWKARQEMLNNAKEII